MQVVLTCGDDFGQSWSSGVVLHYMEGHIVLLPRCQTWLCVGCLWPFQAAGYVTIIILFLEHMGQSVSTNVKFQDFSLYTLNCFLTILWKTSSQPSKEKFRGSHSTCTDVSRTDLNLRPSGAGRSVAEERNILT